MSTVSKYSVPIARVLLGLVFFVFGLNGFFSFIPLSPPEGVAGQFMGGLAASGYFFPLLKGTEVFVGAALLSGLFVPLALVVLAPISLNIMAFHLFLASDGMGMPIMIGVLHIYLAYAYRDAFAGVLQVKARLRHSVTDSSASHNALEGASS